MKTILLFLLLILTFTTFSQSNCLIEGTEIRQFSIKTKNDTIEFILPNGNIDTIKPVLLFCQGSLPIPLIIVLPNGERIIASLNNFDYKKISKNYHLVVISAPKTPLIVGLKNLNKQFCFVPDTSKQNIYSGMYINNNYLENYTARAKKVIAYLYNQKWVDKKRIYILGHSQGSKVAIEASINNKKVSKVGYLSGNPMGRIDQLIREQREICKSGKISIEESQKEIQGIYKMWENINSNPNSNSTEYGDPNRAWTSFSKPMLDKMLKLKQPLFVGYGTSDITASFCDLLPIYFLCSGKTNFKHKPYLGLEHNFFEVDKEGRINYNKCHWQNVLDDFIYWVKN
ncbi:MAG: hypothetical protein SFY56_08705 [Bacteroidota bacterium]|nr:hypothetical protein [Bacteroidota bacterium]